MERGNCKIEQIEPLWLAGEFSFYETSNSRDQEQQYLFSPVLKRAEEREYNVRTPPPCILHSLILHSTTLHPKILDNKDATSLALPCALS
jgi:hypothetical protein